MNKNFKNKELKNCSCDNDSYFYRSNEHFRTNLNDVEFSKDIEHIDYEDVIHDNQYYLDDNDESEIDYDYNREYIENSKDFPNDDDYTIYDHDIENNQGHQWGNKER